MRYGYTQRFVVFIDTNQGIAAFYSFACFPKKDHPDLVHYVQAIPEMLIFANFMNDILRYSQSDFPFTLSC